MNRNYKVVSSYYLTSDLVKLNSYLRGLMFIFFLTPVFHARYSDHSISLSRLLRYQTKVASYLIYFTKGMVNFSEIHLCDKDLGKRNT